MRAAPNPFDFHVQLKLLPLLYIWRSSTATRINHKCTFCFRSHFQSLISYNLNLFTTILETLLHSYYLYYITAPMGRAPCCDKAGLKKGPWTPEEDHKLISYIQLHGPGNWRNLPKNAGMLNFFHHFLVFRLQCFDGSSYEFFLVLMLYLYRAAKMWKELPSSLD